MKVALPFKAQAKAEAIGCFESPFRTFKRLHGHHEDAGGGEDKTVVFNLPPSPLESRPTPQDILCKTMYVNE